MADEYQVEYEYTDGNTISFKTNDLSIDPVRSGLKITTRVDGTRVVTDPGHNHLVFRFTAWISGNTMDTLHGVQTAAITYSGAYPRIKKIYWDGDSTEANIEVALKDLKVLDKGISGWLVAIMMEQKDQ